MATETTISHHFLRRRARKRALWLESEYPGYRYIVRRAERGPWRWRVVRVR